MTQGFEVLKERIKRLEREMGYLENILSETLKLSVETSVSLKRILEKDHK